ncbi:hypothetical protein [Bacteroides thetaiotaomicron]|uniref:hypothetical protein n=1 Tax=Bacteroides thetaiotaomicron TaxID=818 RepID=UPI002165626B|nr:hypothetical protein [Bacteroides thetaiotaomicron]MCS2598890.1 hypothetical protein [Bacteroides thetaiotaomicron]
MKKIMFNDKFGLTQAVLDGRKTMTRRIIKCPRTFRGEWVAGFNIHRRHSDKKIVDWPCMYDADEREFDMGEILPKYKLGEVVAIAQSYKDVDRFHRKGKNADYLEYLDSILPELKLYPGWGNKMFVKADLMPHHIKITGIKVERLQDISDEDCLKEGDYSCVNFSWTKNISYPTCKRILLVNERSPRSFCLLDRQSIRQRYMGRKPICVGV